MLGALHLWTACECSHATWLNTIESFSPSILKQQICCPAVISTAWQSKGTSPVLPSQKIPPVTHEAFVCPDAGDTNLHAARVRCATHNKSHPGNI